MRRNLVTALAVCIGALLLGSVCNAAGIDVPVISDSWDFFEQKSDQFEDTTCHLPKAECEP